VIGLGRIGAQLADLALAFGMRVLAATPQAIDDRGWPHPPGSAARAARRVRFRRLPRAGAGRHRQADERRPRSRRCGPAPSSSMRRAASSVD
jgi:hypothetical protein